MSLDAVGFWTRCWAAIFAGDRSKQQIAAELPTLKPQVAGPNTEATPGAGAVVWLMPDVASLADEPSLSVKTAVNPVSADILILPSDTARHYRLAARLGSVRALNQPKIRIRKSAVPACTTKPLPKKHSAAGSTASRLKPRRHCASPRVLRPVSKSATIIQLSHSRPMPATQSAALQQTA